jgi:methionyl-tRNA formyltransferase
MGNDNVEISNLRTLVVGCTPLARKVVHLLDEISDLVGVVNLSPSKGATKSNYDCMSEFVKENSYRVHWTEDINNLKTRKWITEKKPDILVQCGWSQIFKKKLLDIPKKYCIGIHPSPLPEGRGAAIINWKIIESNNSNVPWGNSLFVMEEKTDTGDILDFEPFVIETRDNVRTAYLKVDETALTMLERTIPKIASNQEKRTKQDNSLATRYYKRTPKDGKIDLSWNVSKVIDFIRALTHPYPGAFLESKYGKITIWHAYPLFSNLPQARKAGEVMWINEWRGVTVATGDKKAVQISRISDASGNEMWADDWAKKVGIKAGDILINE